MTITAPPQIDTVPSSITDDGLEELFEEIVPCESGHSRSSGSGPHTDGFPCTLEAEWRQVKVCGHAFNLCDARRDFWRSLPGYEYLTCATCSSVSLKLELKWVRI